MQRTGKEASEGGHDFAAWKNEPSELTLVQTPDDIRAVAEKITGIYHAPHGLSTEALQGFLTTLSNTPVISAAFFVDAPESSIRPHLNVHAYMSRPMQLREDSRLLMDIGKAHADFLWASERGGSRQDSWILLEDNLIFSTPADRLAAIKEDHMQTPARVVAAIEFPR